jgi:hypothetical protein
LSFELNRVKVFCDFSVRLSENFANLKIVNKGSENFYNLSSDEETKQMNDKKKFADWDIYAQRLCV